MKTFLILLTAALAARHLLKKSGAARSGDPLLLGMSPRREGPSRDMGEEPRGAGFASDSPNAAEGLRQTHEGGAFAGIGQGLPAEVRDADLLSPTTSSPGGRRPAVVRPPRWPERTRPAPGA
jgi:hypothetical protein